MSAFYLSLYKHVHSLVCDRGLLCKKRICHLGRNSFTDELLLQRGFSTCKQMVDYKSSGLHENDKNCQLWQTPYSMSLVKKKIMYYVSKCINFDKFTLAPIPLGSRKINELLCSSATDSCLKAGTCVIYFRYITYRFGGKSRHEWNTVDPYFTPQLISTD